VAAPGGQGKSALIVSEMIAMASGRELLEGERPVRPLRVALKRKLLAIAARPQFRTANPRQRGAALIERRGIDKPFVY